MTNWFDLLVALVWPGAAVFALWFFGDELKGLINRLRSVGRTGAEWWPLQSAPPGDPASAAPLTKTLANTPATGQPAQQLTPRDYVAPVYRPLFDERIEAARSALSSSEARFSVSREEVLIAGIAELSSVLHLERASRAIFRSQVEALSTLSQQTGLLAKDAFRPFYDRAARSFPALYANYNFDQWFSFLVSMELVFARDGPVMITQAGRVIGHYMTERGYASALHY